MMDPIFYYTGVAVWGGVAGLALFALTFLAFDIAANLGCAFGTAFRLARLGSDKGRKS